MQSHPFLSPTLWQLSTDQSQSINNSLTIHLELCCVMLFFSWASLLTQLTFCRKRKNRMEISSKFLVGSNWISYLVWTCFASHPKGFFSSEAFSDERQNVSKQDKKSSCFLLRSNIKLTWMTQNLYRQNLRFTWSGDSSAQLDLEILHL